MAGKILPLGPATFPDMVEDWENEVAVFKAAGEHPGLPEGWIWRLLDIAVPFFYEDNVEVKFSNFEFICDPYLV